MLSLGTQLKYNDDYRLKENDEKDLICKQKSKEVRVATLMSGKINFYKRQILWKEDY